MVCRTRDVILFGPPGVGKGAQAARLSVDFGFERLSMGDLLRQEAACGSDLGRRIRERIDAGRFADDETVGAIVEKQLGRSRAPGLVLDGFPRTIRQAERLEVVLSRSGRRVERAILIEASESTIVERMRGRMICADDGSTYHERFLPPRTPGVCDGCGRDLVRRVDDDPYVRLERVRVYRSRTRPLVEFYRRRGLLEEIDGSGSVDQVSVRIRRSIEERP